MHAAHPLAVALGQVVVDRDDVHALAADGVEVGGQHTGQRLALAGLHLRDVAVVQRGAAHDLDVERPLVEHAPRRLPRHRERLWQQIVEALAVGEALLELGGLGAQLVVGQLLDVLGQGVHIVGDLLEALDHAAFTETEQLRQHAISPVGSMELLLKRLPS